MNGNAIRGHTRKVKTIKRRNFKNCSGANNAEAHVLTKMCIKRIPASGYDPLAGDTQFLRLRRIGNVRPDTARVIHKRALTFFRRDHAEHVMIDQSD